MGRIIVRGEFEGKVYYALWSSIVQAAVSIGTREEMLHELVVDEIGYAPPLGVDDPMWWTKCERSVAFHEFALARADETGTSSMARRPRDLIVGYDGILPIEKIGQYIKLLLEDDEAGALALLEPFDDVEVS